MKIYKRNKKGQFVKGFSGNPEGRKKLPDYTKILELIIKKVEESMNKTLIDHYLERAFISDKVALSLLNKFIPDKRSKEPEINEPVEIIISYQKTKTVEEDEFLLVLNRNKEESNN